MRRIFQVLIIYVLVQQGGQTLKFTWSDGQPVDALLTERAKSNPGTTWQIVNKTAFDLVPDSVVAPPMLDPVKQQAILDAKDSKKSISQRLDALIAAEGF